jgi:YD repeat-containing protein
VAQYSNSPFTVTVTDPAQNQTVHTMGSPAGCGVYENQTDYYQGSVSPSNLIKTVVNQYSGIDDPYDAYEQIGGSGAASVIKTSTTTNWSNGWSTKRVYTYDTGHSFYVNDTTNGLIGPYPLLYGSSVQTDEYDLSLSSSPLRSTIRHFKWQDDSNYLTANLLSLPAYEIVNDGGGNQAARTDYGYDDPSLLTGAGLSTQHGTPLGAVRGNLTSETRWLNAGTSPTSYTNWYDTGEVYQSKDPNGNTTTYSYSPSFTGAYRTGTCYPQTGSVAHCISGNYDFNSGLPTSYTDENNQTSPYSYDNLFRMIGASYPDGGQTTINYNGDPVPPHITKTVVASPNPSIVTDYFYDGLGRIKTKQLSDPSGADLTDTTYDALGRVYSVSNPYRSGVPSPTDGTTYYSYDPLDRVTQITNPNGSTVLTSYQAVRPRSRMREMAHQVFSAFRRRMALVG